jgi:hypothetical protein
LHNRAANFDENLELIEKLEELSAVNEDAAKERDQINEILMKLLSSLDNPKLSQVYSELKFLNTSLRKAKSKEIESRFDETDVNIIERKVNLLMDELTLCIERITSQIKQSNQS